MTVCDLFLLNKHKEIKHMENITIKTNDFITPVDQILASLHDVNDDKDITKAKEKIADNILKYYGIFELLAEQLGIDYQGHRKITSKKLQKSGVDYVMFGENREINIDLKTGIGLDYTMKEEDWVLPTDKNIHDVTNDKNMYRGHEGIAVEITQYDLFTNRKEKATDYDLYLMYTASGINIYLIDYAEINRISNENYYHYEKAGLSMYLRVRGSRKYGPEKAYYEIHKSFNGTGEYIKFPVEKIAKVCFTIQQGE